MKLKWKIGIGLLAFILSLATLLLLNEIPVKVLDKNPEPPSIIVAQPKRSTLDILLENMEFAAIAFNAPTTMNIDDSPQIHLILSLSETVDEIKQSIVEEGEKIGATIRVSDVMEARLTGYMFQITAITPETQAVSKSQRTNWKWDIFPKEEGQHKLHLTLSAILEIDGRSTPRAIRTFSKVIEVNVTTSQKTKIFITNNWQWLWIAILAPIAGWLWKRKNS